MKNKIFLFVVFCLIMTGKTLRTQTPALQKGSMLTGGSAELSFGNAEYKSKSPYGSYTSKSSGTFLSLSPTFGYFVTDGLVLGGLVNLTSQTSKSDDDDDDSKATTSGFSIGPFIRYYTKAKIFFHGEYSFGNEKSTYTSDYYNGEETEKYKLNSWKIGVGYAIFINDHVAIEPHLYYAKQSSKEKDNDFSGDSKVGMVTIGLNFNLFLLR